MDIQKFQQKLTEVCELGEKNGKVLKPEQIKECFGELDLDKSQLIKILQYLKLKGISGFTNTIGNERFVYYDFLCTNFSGDIRASREGEPKWWNLEDIEEISMQEEIKNRLPLYLREGSFESINYWDESKKCISHNKTILFD